MLTKTSYQHGKFIFGFSLFVILSNVMKFGEGKTIFNELIPDTKNCQQRGDFGCLCYGNTECNSTKFLECIDGKCACEYPLHRVYDYSLGKCVGLVGSQCSNAGNWSPECTRYAECEIGHCFCREGYGKTADNTCMINYGEECGPNQCNIDRGLACKEGTCQCIDASYVYSAILTNCLDPEQVVRDIIQRIASRILREVFNYKIRKTVSTVTRPFRALSNFFLFG